MRSTKYRSYSLKDEFIDTLCEGLPDYEDINSRLSGLADQLVDVVKAHVEAQVPNIMEEVTR